MSLVVDASVVAKWYVPEERTREADQLLDLPEELLAPDLLTAEVGNVLRKKVLGGNLTATEAQERAEGFVSYNPVSLRPSGPLLVGALGLALRFRLSLYDSLYLALALGENSRLITADQHFCRAVRQTELRDLIALLGES